MLYLYGIFDREKGRTAIASEATPQQILERILICREAKGRVKRAILNWTNSSQTLESLTRFEYGVQEEIGDLFQYYVASIRNCRTKDG
jgi:hypothetical protein